MKNILLNAFCLIVSAIASAQTQNNTLTISATNFSNTNGMAVVHLFRKNDDVPANPFMRATAIIEEGSTKIIFKELPYGEYAAIVFHDENNNGILDHRWGFPHEPMGFSNGWSLSLFSGMPNFEKLKFRFTELEPVCKIKIN
jgi:uncharacterized protein (DUF2141 family)